MSIKYKSTLIVLSGIATLMDAISIQLQEIGGRRNQRFDKIRCDFEDFREDLKDLSKNEVKV